MILNITTLPTGGVILCVHVQRLASHLFFCVMVGGISAIQLAKPHTMSACYLGSLGGLVVAQMNVQCGFIRFLACESSVCLEVNHWCDVKRILDGKFRKLIVLGAVACQFHHSPAHASPGISTRFLDSTAQHSYFISRRRSLGTHHCTYQRVHRNIRHGKRQHAMSWRHAS